LMPQATDLPEDLKSLVRRNALRITDTSFDGDCQRLAAAIRLVLEKAAAVEQERLVAPSILRTQQRAAAGPFSGQEFSDKEVNDVVSHLRKLHEQQRTEFLASRELLPELDMLFDRKTFRYEALRRCPEQRWADRLDSGYQVLRVLEGYMRNLRQ